MVYAAQAVASRGILVQRDDGLIDCLFSDAPWLNQDLRIQHWLHDWLSPAGDAEFLLYIRRGDGRDIQQYACDLEELVSYVLPSVYEQFTHRQEPLEMLYRVLPDVAEQLGPAKVLPEGAAHGAELLTEGAVWQLAIAPEQLAAHDVAAGLRIMDKVLVDWLKAPQDSRPWLRITQAGRPDAVIPRAYLAKLAASAPWWLLLIHPEEYPAWFSALAQGPDHDVWVGTCLRDKEALMMAAHVSLWEAEAGAISLLYDDTARNGVLGALADNVTRFIRQCLAESPLGLAGKPVSLTRVVVNQGIARLQLAFALLSLSRVALTCHDGHGAKIPACRCRQLPDGSLYVYFLRASELFAQLLIPVGHWCLAETDATNEAWQPHRRIITTLEDMAVFSQQHGDDTTLLDQDRYKLLCYELEVLCRAMQNNLVPGVSLGTMPGRVVLLARNCLCETAISNGLGLPCEINEELATWQRSSTDKPAYAVAYAPASQEKGWVRYAATPTELLALLPQMPGDTEDPLAVEVYGLPIELTALPLGVGRTEAP